MVHVMPHPVGGSFQNELALKAVLRWLGSALLG